MSDSSDAGNLVLGFGFDLERDIQDVVRLGTLGQFQEARSIADESLKQLDDHFPIAIEIMRLMYDQEDFNALYAYANVLMSRRAESWTPRALCILHLMHDVSGMLQGNLTDVATTPRDLAATNLGVSNPENLDEEQIMTTVFILKIVYEMHGEVQASAVIHRRALPVALRQESGLYAFIGSLKDRENYWAADNVMAICLQSRSADYAALLKATERFLRGDSRRDDEPTAYFRMVLMQTFMEGLIIPDASGDRSKLWASFKLASDSLSPVLRKKFGKGVWHNSRGYWRGRFLAIDKALSDRNPQVRQHALRQAQCLLPQLYVHAAQHDDRSLLKVHRSQIALLVRSTPQSPITYLDGAPVVPIGGPASRNAFTSTTGRIAQQKHSPAMETAHRSNIALRSGGSARATAPAPTSALQPRPPWQRSQSLGGYFLYKPSTDMIMLQDGRQYPRPSQVPIAALSSAAWEGPPISTTNTEASGSQRSIELQRVQASGSHGSTNARDQASRPGGSSHQQRATTSQAKDTGQNDNDDEDGDDEDEEEDDDDEEQDQESEYESSGEDSG